MIFLHFNKRKVREPDKEEYSRILERIIPVIIKFNRALSFMNKGIDIDTKIIFK